MLYFKLLFLSLCYVLRLKVVKYSLTGIGLISGFGCALVVIFGWGVPIWGYFTDFLPEPYLWDLWLKLVAVPIGCVVILVWAMIFFAVPLYLPLTLGYFAYRGIFKKLARMAEKEIGFSTSTARWILLNYGLEPSWGNQLVLDQKITELNDGKNLDEIDFLFWLGMLLGLRIHISPWPFSDKEGKMIYDIYSDVGIIKNIFDIRVPYPWSEDIKFKNNEKYREVVYSKIKELVEVLDESKSTEQATFIRTLILHAQKFGFEIPTRLRNYK